MTYQYAKRTLYYNSSTQRTKCTNGFNYSIQKQTSLLGVWGWGALCVTSFITRAHLNCTSANPKLTPPKPVPKQSLGYSPESSHST